MRWFLVQHHGYTVTTLLVIIRQFESQHHTTSDTLAKIGIEHGPASKVMSKLHEYSVLTFHKVTSRRTLNMEKTDKTRQSRPDPP